MNKIRKLSNGLNVWSRYLMKLGWDFFLQNQVGYFDKNMVKQIVRDQFIQKWHSDIK